MESDGTRTVCLSPGSDVMPSPSTTPGSSPLPAVELTSIAAKEAIRADPKKFFAVDGTGTIPLLVFCNPRSGGNAGQSLLESFRTLIDPSQVFDMMEKDEAGVVFGAKKGLMAHRDIDNLFVLVCGGDGTVGWTLSNIEELGLASKRIPVGVVPLGTGNDLANALKSGAKYSGTSAVRLLEGVADLCSLPMDRWTINVEQLEGVPLSEDSSVYGVKPTLTPPQTTWNNYFSLGSDAHCTLLFHTKREKNPERYTSRMRNRMAYAIAGAKEAFLPKFGSLMSNVSLTCDGKDYTEDLRRKKIVALGFLNIPYIGGGTKPWGTKDAVGNLLPPKIWDGMVEVVGFVGQFALMKAQMKSSALHSMRICQAKRVELTLHKPIPVQLDGEPCLFGACKVTLATIHQSIMLAKRKGRYEHRPSILIRRVPREFKSNSVLSGEPTSISVFVVVPTEQSNASYHCVGTVDAAPSMSMAEIRVKIAQIEHEHMPSSWVFLEFGWKERSNSSGTYRFLKGTDEATKLAVAFLDPDKGVRRGFFISDPSSEALAAINSESPAITLVTHGGRRTSLVRNISVV